MSPAETDDNAGGDADLELDPVLDDPEEGEGSAADGEGESDEDQDADKDPEEGEGGSEGDPLAADTGSRSSRRIQALRQREAAATAEAAELRKRLDDVLADQRKQPPAVDEVALRAEAEKVALMEPHERVAYENNKRIKSLQDQVNGLGFHISDATDKATFEAKATIDPIYKKYAGRVEKALGDMRKNNANTTREALLTYMIGQDARERLAKNSNGDQRRRAAAARVENTKGRPATARSDASSSRTDKDSVQALEKRLSGVAI